MPSAATEMNLGIIILSEVTEKDEKMHDSLLTKQKQTHRRRKQAYVYQRGKGKARGYK
jgi:restriction endonuclease S subunit